MQRINNTTKGQKEASESYESVAQTDVFGTENDLPDIESCNFLRDPSPIPLHQIKQ